MWLRVLEPHTKKLLLRFDPERDIIEIQQRGVKTLIDLRQLRGACETAEPPSASERQPEQGNGNR